MKKIVKLLLVFLILATILPGASLASTKEEIEDFSSTITMGMMLIHMKSEGNFRYCVIPITPQHLIAQNYPDYLDKRYSKEKILQKAKAVVAELEGKLVALFLLNFTGDFTSKGETSKEIPDDFNEYVFVENDKGDFVRCIKADIPLMGSVVNYINDSVAIPLTFSLTYEKDGKQFSILENTEYIEFVVGGLGFKDNRFKYNLPLFKMIEQIPEPLKQLYTELGLQEYPRQK